ncbi:Hypothetical Protein FCC1311_058572 [Hondaea fermentalgiana]|uniref:Apple domain-containing protein n=1 Tax=Hondaea fermentalgiana TaxID=2315210 RepID=A0A2R5GFE3_9STRA|nr:Hypothetical Protein FCC1311_058572 [Hondaea fermentalgiana]|eukprot:GBG29636.1 Hypothetical Protein FCC1311_058572 [Hondaea fermentalgiana]
MARSNNVFAALVVVAVAGLWQSAVAQEAPEGCYDVDVLLTGGLLEEFTDIMKADYECHLFCQYEDECVAWSYSSTEDSSICMLFSEVSGFNDTSAGYVSGPKDCESEVEGPEYTTPSPTVQITEAPAIFPDWNETDFSDWNETDVSDGNSTDVPDYYSTDMIDGNSTGVPDYNGTEWMATESPVADYNATEAPAPWPTPLFTETPTMSNETDYNSTEWY